MIGETRTKENKNPTLSWVAINSIGDNETSVILDEAKSFIIFLIIVGDIIIPITKKNRR